MCVCFYGNGQGSLLMVRWACVCVWDGSGMCTTAAPAASVKTAFGLLQTQDRIVACVLACVCVRACMRAC